jgi:hypothetical protein
LIKLAAELYRRERGKMPESAGTLIGTYLNALPEGITPEGPIPDGIE